jgi:hypothetical protein
MKKIIPLATRLQRMRKLMDDVDKLSARITPMDAEIAEIRESILNDFTAQQLSSVTAAGLRVGRVVTPMPTVKDQLKFFKFATQKRNWDLLQKSANTPAWRERMKNKKVVPGVDTFDRVSLSVTRIKK